MIDFLIVHFFQVYTYVRLIFKWYMYKNVSSAKSNIADIKILNFVLALRSYLYFKSY